MPHAHQSKSFGSENNGSISPVKNQKHITNFLKGRSRAWPSAVHRELVDLVCTLSLDELDNHQRSLCEGYHSKAEYNTFHSHDMLEEVPYSKSKRWVAIAASLSDCHQIR